MKKTGKWKLATLLAAAKTYLSKSEWVKVNKSDRNLDEPKN